MKALDEREDIFGSTARTNAIGFDSPSKFQVRFLEERPKDRARFCCKKGKSKGGKGSASRLFFRLFRKGGGKGKKSGKTDSCSARKAKIAEEEIEEEDAEEETRLADEKKEAIRNQTRKARPNQRYQPHTMLMGSMKTTFFTAQHSLQHRWPLLVKNGALKVATRKGHITRHTGPHCLLLGLRLPSRISTDCHPYCLKPWSLGLEFLPASLRPVVSLTNGPQNWASCATL